MDFQMPSVTDLLIALVGLGAIGLLIYGIWSRGNKKPKDSDPPPEWLDY